MAPSSKGGTSTRPGVDAVGRPRRGRRPRCAPSGARARPRRAGTRRSSRRRGQPRHAHATRSSHRLAAVLGHAPRSARTRSRTCSARARASSRVEPGSRAGELVLAQAARLHAAARHGAQRVGGGAQEVAGGLDAAPERDALEAVEAHPQQPRRRARPRARASDVGRSPDSNAVAPGQARRLVEGGEPVEARVVQRHARDRRQRHEERARVGPREHALRRASASTTQALELVAGARAGPRRPGAAAPRPGARHAARLGRARASSPSSSNGERARRGERRGDPARRRGRDGPVAERSWRGRARRSTCTGPRRPRRPRSTARSGAKRSRKRSSTTSRAVREVERGGRRASCARRRKSRSPTRCFRSRRIWSNATARSPTSSALGGAASTSNSPRRTASVMRTRSRTGSETRRATSEATHTTSTSAKRPSQTSFSRSSRHGGLHAPALHAQRQPDARRERGDVREMARVARPSRRERGQRARSPRRAAPRTPPPSLPPARARAPRCRAPPRPGVAHLRPRWRARAGGRPGPGGRRGPARRRPRAGPASRAPSGLRGPRARSPRGAARPRARPRSRDARRSRPRTASLAACGRVLRWRRASWRGRCRSRARRRPDPRAARRRACTRTRRSSCGPSPLATSPASSPASCRTTSCVRRCAPRSVSCATSSAARARAACSASACSTAFLSTSQIVAASGTSAAASTPSASRQARRRARPSASTASSTSRKRPIARQVSSAVCVRARAATASGGWGAPSVRLVGCGRGGRLEGQAHAARVARGDQVAPGRQRGLELDALRVVLDGRDRQRPLGRGWPPCAPAWRPAA